MQIKCRKQDVKAFEECQHQFQVEDEGEKLVLMYADEVNYGSTDELPDGVPYTGWHGAGGDYGEHEFACDGKDKYDDAEQGHGNDGYVIVFDDETGEPSQDNIQDVKDFILFRNQVQKMMEETSVEAEVASE